MALQSPHMILSRIAMHLLQSVLSITKGLATDNKFRLMPYSYLEYLEEYILHSKTLDSRPRK